MGKRGDASQQQCCRNDGSRVAAGSKRAHLLAQALGVGPDGAADRRGNAPAGRGPPAADVASRVTAALELAGLHENEPVAGG